MRLLPIAILFGTASANAQFPTGTIIGTVSDSSGAVIPGAAVTITEKSTGAKRTVDTDGQGAYAASSVRVGQYEVRAESKGFRTTVRDATVETGSSTTVHFSLEVGATTEVIHVESASAQIATDSFKIDGVITRQQIQDLP